MILEVRPAPPVGGQARQFNVVRRQDAAIEVLGIVAAQAVQKTQAERTLLVGLR